MQLISHACVREGSPRREFCQQLAIAQFEIAKLPAHGKPLTNAALDRALPEKNFMRLVAAMLDFHGF